MVTLSILQAASHDSRSAADLQVHMAEQIQTLRPQLAREPELTPRLQKLIDQPINMKWLDSEDLVDAFAKVIDCGDERLQAELLALTVTVARLGSVVLAMRLGRKVIEEMNTDCGNS